MTDLITPFKLIKEEDDIIVKAGNRVDYRGVVGKWDKAIIDNFKETKNGKLLLLRIEDSKSQGVLKYHILIDLIYLHTVNIQLGVIVIHLEINLVILNLLGLVSP